MRIRFWGTRGSLPKPGPTTLRYGGNTSCVEVRTPDGTCLVFDCGTGAQALGQALMASGQGPVRGHLFIGHTHWDHIQGIPFFAPLFVQGNEWDIYAPKGMGSELRQTLAGQMQYTYFPVPLDALSATLRYHELLEQTLPVGDALITTRYLNHPALTLGYRVEAGGASFAYLTDHEPHGRTQACGRAHAEAWHHPEDSRHAEFIRGVDLLVHDAQYTAAEYPHRIGWGHSTVEYLVDMACDAGVKRLALYHHDPMRSDEQVDRLVEAARERAARLGGTLEIFAAAEGQVVVLAESASARKRHVEPSPEPEHGLTRADREQCVVLALRDEPLVHQLREELRHDGLRITQVREPAELLHLLKRESPAVVLVEHVPGVQEGLAMCREVRQLGDCAATDVPLVLVAKEASAEQLEEGFTAGANEWLLQPFTPAQARTKVLAWLLRTQERWAPAALPVNEPDRVEALEQLGVLEAGREERFNRIARVTARLMDVPLSAVNLISRDRQVCKGMNRDFPEVIPRHVSLCAHTILGEEALVIADARQDARLGDNVLFSKFQYRFYAGVPLRTATGHAVGTLCLFDDRPRQFGQVELRMLMDMALIAQRELLGAEL